MVMKVNILIRFLRKESGLQIRLMIGIILLVLSAGYIGFAQADDSLSLVLDGIKQRYANLPGITVPYERDILTGSMAMLGETKGKDQAAGEMLFKPPFYMAINQQTPKSETITTNGKHLWWYVPDKKQVYKYPYSRLGKEMRLLSEIFQGLSDIADSFDVIQSELGDEQEYHLKLIPNPPWQETDHIDLSVERDNFYIRSVEIYNYMGSVTRFKLDNFSVRNDLEDDSFIFVVPEGIKVIEENG